MRITLADVPKQGLDLRFSAEGRTDRDAVAAALEGDVVALDGTLRVTREAEGLAAQVTGAATVTRPCDRCGAPVDVTVPVDTRLVYVPLAEADEEELQIAQDALDLGFLDGDGIDTEQILSEAFVLESPRRVTCAGDACPNARPLGEGTQDAQGHPAFAVLKKLL